MKKIILFFVLILSSCQINTKDVFFRHNQSSQVSLVAVGDNLIHHTIYQSGFKNGSYDFKPIYKYIKPYIKQHDLAFVNQETILGGSEIGLSTYPLFNSPYEIGDALVDAGFNLISLANNHTLDRGEIAIKNSIHYWRKQPVIYSGSEIENTSHVKVFSLNQISFAFVAYTYGTNGLIVPEGKDYLVNLYSYEKAKDDIEKIRNEVDVIIVSMHWGREYHQYPSDIQREQARDLAHLGVDLILGHHPHIIEPIEVIKKNGHETYVVYSLGNFLSDQTGIDRLIGMAFSIDIDKEFNQNITRIHLENPKAKLFYTNKEEGFQNIFFSDLNQHILPQYELILQDKKTLIHKYDHAIQVS